MPVDMNNKNTGSDAASRQYTVLVVEDENGPRESLKLILEPEYRVLTAANGKEALEVYDANVLDVILSDIRMPVMTGVDLMKAVRRRSPDVPVVLITGYGTLQTAREAVRNGAFDYISKPYDVNEIRTVVRNAILEADRKQEGARSIVRLQSMNTELEKQIQELNQKAAIGDLSAEMIHDLNNPISVLRGYIALLEDSLLHRAGAQPGEEQEFLDIIKEQIERCMRLTRNFLDYARNSRRSWDRENLNSVIEDSLFVLRVKVRSLGISLETNFSDDLPESWIQPTPLQQVFYNLISNAVEAMEHDAGTNPRLSLTTSFDGSGATPTIEVSIKDTGPGIPEDRLEQIFTPFFTTKPKGKGTGLGLAICKRIVDEHEGRILIQSKPGLGTCVRIRLPVRDERPAATVEQAESGVALGQDQGHG